MEKKHAGKIIALLLLMFISSFGQYSADFLKADMDFETSGGYAFLLSLMNVGLITIVMMAVPLIVRLVNGTKLPNARGKRLCLWNSIILFIASIVLMAIADIGFVGGIGAVIYYYINKWVFVDETAAIKAHAEQQPVPVTEKPIHVYLSDVEQEHTEHSRRNVYGSDITLGKSNAAATSYHAPKPQPSVPVATPPKAPVPHKKAIGVGMYTIISVLSIALVIACVACIILYSSIADLSEENENLADLKAENATLKKEIEELAEENKLYYEYYEESFHKIDILDSRIVFIENDGTNWYHRYECSRFVGNDWWAHNTEYAEYLGYTHCPYCFD